MSKKKRRETQGKSTGPQFPRRQQKKRRQRIIFGVAIFSVVAVLGIAGAMWYFNQHRPMNETVIKVNGTSFNMDYYIKTLQIYGAGQGSSALTRLADEVITSIQQNELLKQGAAKLGVSISQDEVDEEHKHGGHLFLKDFPLSNALSDVYRGEIMLKNKLLNDYFEKQVPVFSEQRRVMAMLLESESQATEVRARIEAGEDFAELAKHLSLESLSREGNGDLGWQPKNMLIALLGSSVIDEYAFDSEIGVLSQPIYDDEIHKNMGYWIARVYDRKETPETARVRGILLGSEEDAWWVRAKLLDGKDFRQMAEVLSEHEWSKEDGGNLGWFSPGQAGSAFDEFVFNPEVESEVVSEPIFDDVIKPEGGYWLIQVEEKKPKKETADVDAILLGTKEEAQEVKARLEAGEDFGKLANELSQHEKSREEGGDLGWLTPSQLTSVSPVLTEFVFNPEIEVGTISEPIRDENTLTKTNGGYWLVQVIDKDDNRQIEESDRHLLKARALEEWIESMLNNPGNKFENYLDDNKKSWAIEQARKL